MKKPNLPLLAMGAVALVLAGTTAVFAARSVGDQAADPATTQAATTTPVVAPASTVATETTATETTAIEPPTIEPPTTATEGTATEVTAIEVSTTGLPPGGPPIPASHGERACCLVCHADGFGGAPEVPAAPNHSTLADGRAVCTACHPQG